MATKMGPPASTLGPLFTAYRVQAKLPSLLFQMHGERKVPNWTQYILVPIMYASGNLHRIEVFANHVKKSGFSRRGRPPLRAGGEVQAFATREGKSMLQVETFGVRV